MKTTEDTSVKREIADKLHFLLCMEYFLHDKSPLHSLFKPITTQ